jgi:hypothetical protein
MTWPGWMRPTIEEGHRNRGFEHDVAVAIWQESLSVIPAAMHEARASMRRNGGPVAVARAWPSKTRSQSWQLCVELRPVGRQVWSCTTQASDVSYALLTVASKRFRSSQDWIYQPGVIWHVSTSSREKLGSDFPTWKSRRRASLATVYHGILAELSHETHSREQRRTPVANSWRQLTSREVPPAAGSGGATSKKQLFDRDAAALLSSSICVQSHRSRRLAGRGVPPRPPPDH